MSILSKILTIGALLNVSACTNSTGFGGSGSGGTDAAGVAGSPSDPTSVAYFQQTIGDRIVFVVDQSSLTDQARVVLTAQADWLLSNADYNAIIEGHADEQGTREYNVALGERRANTVRDYLVSKGVPSSRLRVVSYGKERPIEICSAEGCYAKNRRAVTVLAAGLSG